MKTQKEKEGGLQMPESGMPVATMVAPCTCALQCKCMPFTGNAAGDRSTGISGLVVLPSDEPSGRHEATDVHILLQSITSSPALAADRCRSSIHPAPHLYRMDALVKQSVDYTFSSHLGLIRCLSLIVRFSTQHPIHTFTEKLGNTHKIISVNQL